MREKTTKPVVTFATTSDVLALETSAGELGLSGRIIPVPSEIDAGCGLAWCVENMSAADVRVALERTGAAFEGVFSVALY